MPGIASAAAKAASVFSGRPAVIAPMGQQEHRQPPGVAARSGPAIGIANEKVDPTPSSDSAQIRPPCASTTWRAIERPRPVPPAPRVAGPVDLVEALEDPRQRGARDPRAVILHRDDHLRLGGP